MEHFLLQPAPQPFNRGHLDGHARSVGWKWHDLQGQLSIRERCIGWVWPLRRAWIFKGRMGSGPYLRLQFLQYIGVEKDCTQSRIAHNPETGRCLARPIGDRPCRHRSTPGRGKSDRTAQRSASAGRKAARSPHPSLQVGVLSVAHTCHAELLVARRPVTSPCPRLDATRK